MVKRQFATWDWVLFGAMLGISALIGVFYALKSRFGANQNTTGEFLMGGRKLKLLPVSISILVSFMSAITILGAPAEMYTAGTIYFLYTLGLILGCITSACLFVPLFYPLKLTSSFEYLEQRFQSKAAKLTGALIMIVQQVIYIGISSFAPSTALEAVTGFPTWATIVIIGGVSTFYTFLGGMKAVVWTDVFQSIVMFAGLLAIALQGMLKVGGFGEVWRINEKWDRIEFWEPDPDPTVRHSVWSLVVGGTVMWMGVFGVSQASVQRYCAVPTLKKAIGAVLMNIVGCIILMVLACLAGVVMFAYYAETGCDPLSAGEVDNANQLIPYFVMEVLGYPGLPGLFVSCLFSGALSSVSSSLNALAAVFWEDIFKPLIGGKISESNKTWITRVLVAVTGGAGIGFAFLAKNLGGTVLQVSGDSAGYRKHPIPETLLVLYHAQCTAPIHGTSVLGLIRKTVSKASFSFTGAASGPLLGVFLLGGLFPFTNAAGCVSGGILGLVLAMWVSIGAYSLPNRGYKLDFPTDGCPLVEDLGNTTETSQAVALSTVQHFYTVSYLWFPAIGTAGTVIIGVLVSLVTGPLFPKREIDPKYLIPLFDRLFCYLPNSWRKPCRCGYDFKDPEDLVEQEEEAEIINSKAALTDITEIDGTKKNKRDVIFQDGVSNLAYRPSKSEFVYDNPMFIKEGRNIDNITVCVTNV